VSLVGGALGLAAVSDCSVRIVDHDRVAAARSRMIPSEEAQQLTELFRLLGDPTRVRILYALVEVGELCVCDLAAVVDVPETSVSHALRLLRASGVVRNRKSGRMVYCSLADAHVRMLLDVSAEHLRHEPHT
jgi:DNA-binding transcriptional ArsR family regulator